MDSPTLESLDRISTATDERVFFETYVATRTPVIVDGLLDDAAFKAQKWTDLEYLASVAGDSKLMVEPMGQASKQFGTGEKRLSMTFRDFLGTLNVPDGPYHYLTTQYSGDETELSAMFPPPTLALRKDYPVKPRLMGNLVLEQVNIWLGQSKEGSSSGLHHDFHDNLYCLLQGHKRFVLYPPSSTNHLHPHGDVDTIHPNGLISYKHFPVRSDGLTAQDAAERRLEIAQRKMQAAKTRRANQNQLKKLKKELDEAQAAWRRAGGGKAPDAPRDTAPQDQANSQSDKTQTENPSSFSRIPTAYLHNHLKLRTTAIAPPSIQTSAFTNITNAGSPHVIEIKAGEMLYLPASWWHEVTSTGTEEPHMAFNYWFHPPDALDKDRFDEPYQDTAVWRQLRKTAEKLALMSEKKRKRSGVEGDGHAEGSLKKKAI